MFESLVEVRRDAPSALKAWTLPLAVALHFAFGGAIVLYSVLKLDPLLPPDHFPSFPTVSLMGGSSLPESEKREEAPAKKEPREPQPASPQEIAQAAPSEEVPAAGTNGIKGTEGLFDNGDFPGTGLFPPVGNAKGEQMTIPIAPPQREIYREESGILPLKLVKQVVPKYPDTLRALGIQGTVVLDLVIDEEGRVESVEVVSSTNALFTEAALKAVNSWRYRPPVSKAGMRVAIYKRVVIRFNQG